ncbi:MAG: UvrD-helicase domain-containing protein [Caldimonas sp.]
MTAPHDARPAYRIDGRSVASSAFYAVACDPRRSVSVEACAGAGKTWMLVSRVLRALLDGAEPHEILAITFTRKAAGEMRTRLNEWLRKYAAGQCSDAERVRALCERGLGEAEARALAPVFGALYERVLSSGRRVEIRTFHAWFAQLLRAAPLELLTQLGLHAEMEVLDDLDEHRARIERRFHAAVLADPALAADYHALVRDRGRTQVRKWLAAAWDKRIEIELADAAGTLEGSVPSAAAHWPEHRALAHPAEQLRSPRLAAMLREAVAAMARHDGAICRKQGAALELALEIRDHVRHFEQVHAALFTQKGEARRGIDAPGVAELVELVAEIRSACVQQSAHDEHGRMVRLARVLLRETAAYKRARGLADMADLERCALALLRDATLSGWVQERLDMRVRHLLIDEFQDTSPLQWHALHAWLSAYAGAGGGASGQRPPSVFIVGDPKQSIYRFRRAEPRVFDGAREFIVEGLGGTALACDHTRRNAPEVLGVVNAVFDDACRRGEFDGFRPHTTAIAPVVGAGAVALPRVPRPPALSNGADADFAEGWRDSLTEARVEAEEKVREPEARQVAAAVQHLIAAGGFRPVEIYVLCRKRESLRLVADALAALHVPFAAAEDYTLLDAVEARDLVAVLDVLASPQHALSLAQALRSPLFGASDDDLVALAAAAGAHGGWWNALRRIDTASAPLRRAAELLGRRRGAARTLPPHDLLDRIVAEGEFRERVAAAVPSERRAAALDAIDALLGLALTLDGARYSTPYNFVRALKRRAVSVPAPTRDDAVQLLTVHGAKGLEARAVFVMDADPEPQNPESATLLVDWPVESAHPLRCAFVYSETNCAPSLERLRERELAARRREELNGLYVAMTRARERLCFSATEPYRPVDEPSWWRRVEPHVGPLGARGPVDGEPSSEPVRIRVLPQWAGPARGDRVPAPIVAPDPSDDDASRLGQAVHRVLEWAAARAGATPELALLAAGAAREFGVAAGEVARIAARIWDSPACARFFGGAALRWAGNEVAVADAGDVLRIDRLVALDEDGRWVWWVLDYKLRHAPEELVDYRAQLLRYGRAVRALQPGATVRCAFVTGAGAVIEIDAAVQPGAAGATP